MASMRWSMSLAMAMIDTDLTEPGTELSVHVVGKRCSATVVAHSPYDPAGEAMRG